MTRLILLRHAKSSWDAPMNDHARSLAPRGREAAARIGKWLVAEGHRPDLVLCSDARRTQETARGVLAAFPDGARPEVRLSRSLYHASPETLLDAARAGGAEVTLLIAHNPGIGLLAQSLAAEAPDHPRFDDYPTAATTILEFEGEMAPGAGRCLAFVVPRDLSPAEGED